MLQLANLRTSSARSIDRRRAPSARRVALGLLVLGLVAPVPAIAQLTAPGDPAASPDGPAYFNGLWREAARTEARRASSLAELEAHRAALADGVSSTSSAAPGRSQASGIARRVPTPPPRSSSTSTKPSSTTCGPLSASKATR